MTLTLQVKWKQLWFSYFSFILLQPVLKATGNQDQAPAWNKQIQEYSIVWLDTWESWFLTLRARSNIHFLFFYILFVSFSMPLPKGNASAVRETTVVALRTCFSHFRILAQKKILYVLMEHGPEISTVQRITQQWREANHPVSVQKTTKKIQRTVDTNEILEGEKPGNAML